MTILKAARAAAVMLAGAAVFASASAADLDPPRESLKDDPVRLFSWTGFYLGANAGAGWGHADWTISGAPDSFSSARLRGTAAGGQAGYLWELRPRWLLGAEASLSWTRVNGHAAEPIFPQFTDHTGLNWTGDLSARLGYAIRDRTLLFAKAGLALGNFDHSTANSAFALLSEHSRDSTRPGLLIGAGVETALRGNWSLRAEYDWLDFRDGRFDLVDGIGEATPSVDDHHVSIVKAGIAYTFRHDAEPLK